MRQSWVLLLSLWFAVPVLGIEIEEPPESTEVGDDLDLAVSGLAFADLEGANIEFFPKEKVRVKGVWNWGAGPEIEFRARLPGKYQVHVCATVNGRHEHDTVEIIVVSEDGVDPPPPPPPSSLTEVVVVEEASDPLKYKYFQTIKDSEWRDHLRQKKISFSVVDQHLPNHQTVTPGVAASIKAAQKAGLLPDGGRPAVVFLDGSRVIGIRSLPSSPQGMLDLVKGGE